MIKFMRVHAAKIGWIIVFGFAGSMLAGTLFYRNFSRMQPGNNAQQKQIDYSNEIAVLGDKLPVSSQKYMEAFNMIRSSFIKDHPNETVTPEYLEIIQYRAFMQAMQYTVLLQGARSQELKADRKEINLSLENVYKQQGLKGKSELKKLLKERGYPYKSFLQTIKNDIILQKFIGQLNAQIHVSDKDVENKYTELNAQHILIKYDSPNPGSKTDMASKEAAAKVKAEEVFAKIQAGMDFAEAAKTFSEDPGSKNKGGSLDWFGYGQMLPEFENTAYSLEIGEISRPVKTMYGYHIIKLLDKREIERPKEMKLEEEKQKLLAEKQDRQINTYIQTFLSKNELVINDPLLKAFKNKMKGNFEGAVGAYQSLISKNPESPIPHYLIAKLYTMINQPDDASKELQKAIIKGEMNPQLDLAVTHIEMAKLYEKEKNKKDMWSEYDKALELGKNDMGVLRQLEIIFKEKKSNKRLDKVKAEIDRIETMAKQQATTTENVVATTPNSQ